MAQVLRRVVVIGLTAAGLAWHGSGLAATDELADRAELQKLYDELREVQVEIEQLKRFLPPSFERAEVEAAWRSRAQRAELAGIDIKPVAGSDRVPLEGGRPSPVELRRVDVSGRDPYGKVHLFLSMLLLTPRLFDLETLVLEADAGGSVRFSARLALAHWTSAVEAPAVQPTFQDQALDALVARRKALDDEIFAARRKAAGGTVAEQKEALRNEMLGAQRRAILDRMIEIQGNILQHRLLVRTLVEFAGRAESARRAVAALGAFAREAGEEALALTRVRFAGETVLEGVVAGAAARAGLGAALEKAGFHLAGMKMSPAGQCQAFSVTVRPKEGEASPVGVGLNGLFEDRTAAVCSPEPRAAVGRVEVRGRSAAADGSALTLRLRDVDVTDVFLVLHGLTSQSFVVDPDLEGRVDVDVDAATLEEALAAMSSAGMAVGPGPVRRVSRAGVRPPAAAPPRASYSQPISVSFKDGDLGDVLCLLKSILGRTIWVPADLEGKVSVFTTETPWDQMLDAVAASSGLVLVVEEERLFLGPAEAARTPGQPGAVDACKMGRATDHRRPWRDRFRGLEKLGVRDLALAGLARSEGAWRAYAYGLSRMLLSFEAGQSLFDGRVSAVGPTGVTFQTRAEGIVEVPLRP